MKVFVITEGSSFTGFGHLTRCISLYQAFEERDIQPVFIINGDETVKEFLQDKNHEIFDWIAEEKRLLRYIENADIIIIDSYLANYELYEKVSKLAKVPVYIDDNKRIDYPRGIVVNGTIYADELNYPAKQDVAYLLGSQYIPIRKEFWDVPDKEIKENIATIIITFGGDDARNMTPGILKLLNENFPKLTKKVIIGKGFKNIKQIEDLKDDKTDLIYYPDAKGMKKIMLESDIALSAGGQTLYELARVSVPTIAIAVADNQMNNVRGWQKARFIEYAGWWNENDIFINITKKIELLQNADLREEKSTVGRKFADGLGALRIVSYCIKTFFENSLVLRKAEPKDMYKIYKLSNDPDVRKNSFNSDKIKLENHKIWFLNKLKSGNYFFLVAEINNTFVGQVRFDINGNEAVISISMMKQYRGIGMGKFIIKRAIHLLVSDNPDILYVKAYIKIGNMHSAGFFESTGFHFVQEIIINGQHAMQYGYQLKKV